VIENYRVLGLIPARGGSKGLPGKNVRPLHGKPLIAWSIEAALTSRYIDEVIVSTDSEEIAAVASQHRARVEKRPEHLAGDAALVADAIRYVLDALNENGETFDIVVLLQPTSPIRPDNLVDECIEELVEKSVDSLATFSDVGLEPERLWTIDEGTPSKLLTASDPWLPRQALSKVYALNGLVYVFRVPPFMSEQTASVLVGRPAAKITDPYIDIDTLDDFLEAERQMPARTRDASA
jgi:CMP-N-acetylneuraminic acid synthetase